MKNNIIYKTCFIFNKTLVYIIHGKDGDLLIDTGSKLCQKAIDKWIKKKHFNIKHILLTHGHFDHSYNLRFFKTKYHAQTIVHKDDIHYLFDEDKPNLQPSNKKYEKRAKLATNILLKFNSNFCAVDYQVDENSKDLLKELGYDAEILMLPGHTKGSIGVLSNNVLYSGDACSAIKGVYYEAMFGENVENIHKTNKFILNLNPDYIAPGHGRIIDNTKHTVKYDL